MTDSDRAALRGVDLKTLKTFFNQPLPWKLREEWHADGCDWFVDDADGHWVADCGGYEELACLVVEIGTAIPALLDALDRCEVALQHAVSENLAFNVKVATEINEARAQRDAALARAEKAEAELAAEKRRVDRSAAQLANEAKDWPASARHMAIALLSERDAAMAECERLRVELAEVNDRAVRWQAKWERDYGNQRAWLFGADATQPTDAALEDALKFDERIWRAYLTLKTIHREGLLDAIRNACAPLEGAP